jgi:hypothetical protein
MATFGALRPLWNQLLHLIAPTSSVHKTSVQTSALEKRLRV